MFKKTPLASAIGTITLASALATVGATLPAFAEEADEGALEEVIVTGSRIKSTVSDAPRPITVIDELDIELSGMESVADVLRNTTYNTLGSFRERSGSSFGQIALVDLRGLGADRTAVLINGRRVPGNPLTGSSAVDLNTIPLSAVKRVEILTDSASAVYGADAIGGVVNIIFKDDYEGATIEIGSDFPDREGAESDHINLTFGANGEKGNIIFGIEWFKRNPVFDVDRDYSAVQVNAPTGVGPLPLQGVDTVGVSGYGNTGVAMDFSSAWIVDAASCTAPTYIPVADPFGIPGEGCGFGYADLSMQTGGIERQSTFLMANYEINDDHQLYFENRISRSKTFGRYAPVAADFVVDAAAPLNTTGSDFILLHRFVAHGNRDDSVQTLEHDNVIGLKGSFDNIDINYDTYLRYYEYVAQEEGDTYIITSIIEDLVADGSYDFTNPFSQDPTHLAAIAKSSATLFRDIQTEYTEFGVALDGNFGSLSGGAIGWAAGFEMSTEQYQDQYDSMREANNVGGSAGNSASGARSKSAFFGEVSLPLLENLEVGVAVRYDDYDDFGQETSPSLSVRYKPIDMLTLRASWGEGFKAPNLTQMYSALSESHDPGKDILRCEALGIPIATCPNPQYENYTGGNPDLQAETSESFNLGVVVEPIDGLAISVDWYTIKMEDQADAPTIQTVFNLEADGALPSGVIVNRGATVGGIPGNVTTCVGGVQPPNCGIIRPTANLSEVEVEGIDIRAQYDWDTDSAGSFRATWEYSELLSYDRISLPGTPSSDLAGTAFYPETRSNLGLRWMMGDWSVSYAYHTIDEHADVGYEFDSYDSHDVTAIWQTPYGGEISVGVRNLTDEDPELPNGSGWDDDALYLYDVGGRMYFAGYKHTF